MSLKLQWNNKNVVPTHVLIYRGDAALDSSSLPLPLVTLTNGETEWVDATAQFGKTYFYILGTKTDTDLVLTPNQKITVADNRGAGPSALLVGDDNLGYYGTVSSADFFNSGHLIAVAKKLTGIPTALVQPMWHKFVRKGKIIYLPDASFGMATWNNLYAAGLVYGVDGPLGQGAVQGGTVPVNQLCVMTLNGENYKPRLMRGWSDGVLNNQIVPEAPGYHDTAPNTENNEWNDLVYPLFFLVPLLQRMENVGVASWDTIVGAPTTNTTSFASMYAAQDTGRCLCQERGISDNPLNRGVRSVVWGQTSPVPHTRNDLSIFATNALNDTRRWWPVIELVDYVELNV